MTGETEDAQVVVIREDGSWRPVRERDAYGAALSLRALLSECRPSIMRVTAPLAALGVVLCLSLPFYVFAHLNAGEGYPLAIQAPPDDPPETLASNAEAAALGLVDAVEGDDAYAAARLPEGAPPEEVSERLGALAALEGQRTGRDAEIGRVRGRILLLCAAAVFGVLGLASIAAQRGSYGRFRSWYDTGDIPGADAVLAVGALAGVLGGAVAAHRLGLATDGEASVPPLRYAAFALGGAIVGALAALTIAATRLWCLAWPNVRARPLRRAQRSRVAEVRRDFERASPDLVAAGAVAARRLERKIGNAPRWPFDASEFDRVTDTHDPRDSRRNAGMLIQAGAPMVPVTISPSATLAGVGTLSMTLGATLLSGLVLLAAWLNVALPAAGGSARAGLLDALLILVGFGLTALLAAAYVPPALRMAPYVEAQKAVAALSAARKVRTRYSDRIEDGAAPAAAPDASAITEFTVPLDPLGSGFAGQSLKVTARTTPVADGGSSDGGGDGTVAAHDAAFVAHWRALLLGADETRLVTLLIASKFGGHWQEMLEGSAQAKITKAAGLLSPALAGGLLSLLG